MKRELALQLLQTILPNLNDEGTAAKLFRELQFLADYKYNRYEMYHPGRLFLENLYLWLHQFDEVDRPVALSFVREQLIFVSREEFQQLAQALYHDRVHRRHLERAAQAIGLPTYRVRASRDSAAFRRTVRASLYVGMSDGARLDYIRRHNLDINNEQVLPYYAASGEKIEDCLQSLQTDPDVKDPAARFRCLFLIDDFAGSGKTLLREIVTADVRSAWTPPPVPQRWKGRIRFKADLIELEYGGPLSTADRDDLLTLAEDKEYRSAVDTLAEKARLGATLLKGSLQKVATGYLSGALEPDASIHLCPLLTTEFAVARLKTLIPRLSGAFGGTVILPGAVIDGRVRITDASSPIGTLCEKYYDEGLGDVHTGIVKFGYDGCGLPLVLHHNTPNDSLSLLWARRSASFSPLFVRYERHGREAV